LFNTAGNVISPPGQGVSLMSCNFGLRPTLASLMSLRKSLAIMVRQLPADLAPATPHPSVS
jgi:hypothetical protein